MTQSLVKGANTRLADAGALPAVLVDLAWRSAGLECDVTALVCGADRKVLDDDHFVFYNQPVTPEHSVFLLTGNDTERAQVAIDVTALPPGSERIVIALATMEPGATLGVVSGLRASVIDPAGRATLATYEVGEITAESCLIICEIYLHGGSWKVRAVGQGYFSGLEGLSRDYGVDV